MMLRSFSHHRGWGAFVSAGVLVGILAAGCERDDTADVDRNRPPETFITDGPINSEDPEDPTDLFYRAHISWRGEDVDGRVVGFRYAIDDTTDPGAWGYTTQTDSTFRFQVGEVGSKEHIFFIRSVDDLGKQDATPDTLRFEAYTVGPPTVSLVKMEVNGQPFPFTGRDTVLVESDVKWTWTGSDPDGEIVGWESKFDNEVEYRFHERNDTTRTEVGLNAGLHTLIVVGIDDAGAKSANVGRFSVWSNFDPKTTVDRSTIVAKLFRPWLDVPDTLTYFYTDDGVANDTLPSRSTLSFCWSTTDKDGPIRDWFWFFAAQGEQTTDSCATTETLLVDDLVGGLPLLVRARDVYGQAETPSDTVMMLINYAPTVVFTEPSPPPVIIGQPHRFFFTSDDKDSDPDSLRYQWRFWDAAASLEPIGPFSTEVAKHPDSLFVEETFTPSEAGFWGLQLRAFESGGSRTISDIVTFSVVPPTAAEAARRRDAIPPDSRRR